MNAPPLAFSSVPSLLRHGDSGMESEIGSPDSQLFSMPNCALLLAKPAGWREIREFRDSEGHSFAQSSLSGNSLQDGFSWGVSPGQVQLCLLGFCPIIGHSSYGLLQFHLSESSIMLLKTTFCPLIWGLGFFPLLSSL